MLSFVLHLKCFTFGFSVDSLRVMQWDGGQGGSLFPIISINRSPDLSP